MKIDTHTRRLIEIASPQQLRAMLRRNSVSGGHQLTREELSLIDQLLEAEQALRDHQFGHTDD